MKISDLPHIASQPWDHWNILVQLHISICVITTHYNYSPDLLSILMDTNIDENLQKFQADTLFKKKK